MVVELRDKITALEPGIARGAAAAGIPGEARQDADDAVAALVNLGYRRKEAEKAVARAARDGAGALEEMIRRALVFLSG